jgi:hypothetical protein
MDMDVHDSGGEEADGESHHCLYEAHNVGSMGHFPLFSYRFMIANLFSLISQKRVFKMIIIISSMNMGYDSMVKPHNS